MVQQWPEELPNDAAIARYLDVEKRYNPKSIALLIADFRSTYAFAGLGIRVSLVEEGEETLQEAAGSPADQQTGVEPPGVDVEALQSEKAPEASPGGQSKTGATPATKRSIWKYDIPLQDGGRLIVRYPKRLQERDKNTVESILGNIQERVKTQ